jgi:hypothetical protein
VIELDASNLHCRDTATSQVRSEQRGKLLANRRCWIGVHLVSRNLHLAVKIRARGLERSNHAQQKQRKERYQEDERDAQLFEIES